MSGTTIKPPVQVAPYVEVLGVEGTVDFLLEFGGAQLHLSRNPRKSRVAERFGRAKAAQLAEVAESLPARVPLQRRWCAQVLYSRGLPVQEIARRIRVTDVTVRAYVRDLPDADPNQPSLFD